jgi:hypothetical protein
MLTHNFAVPACQLAALHIAVIEPCKAQRAGMWAAVGGIAGYYGFKEQQALRAALLQRQQELEQSELLLSTADFLQQVGWQNYVLAQCWFMTYSPCYPVNSRATAHQDGRQTFLRAVDTY